MINPIKPLPIARILFALSFCFLILSLHFLMIGSKVWGYGLIFPAFTHIIGALYLFRKHK